MGKTDFSKDPNRGTDLVLTDDERKAVDFVDAAQGLAGHQVTSRGSRTRNVLVSRGEMSVEEANRLDLDELVTQSLGR